ncbi:TlyA family RNA methyltransferase [Pseudolysinimonas sp.]|uniref:TlyA family RNA methyltransferase n=1 Tax=Pseudolysinimonas sp. TaxID=2680009 RepID=UPI003F7CFD7E
MPAEGSRLDAELVRRGIARSRTQASQAIAEGRVTVDGVQVVKPSSRVAPDADLALTGDDGYVGRAAHKLIAALDAFDVDPAGRFALDIGASTGGFTQVLLERGARRVLALDVGHGQLAEPVRSDPRVVVVEGENARTLTAAAVADWSDEPEPADLVVADLSFIPLATVLPALVASASADADFVLLIKPQFEVGRGGVREGIVRDRALRRDAVTAVLWAAHDLGLRTAGLVPSPILGGAGNHEYLVRFSAAVGADPSEWRSTVSALA